MGCEFDILWQIKRSHFVIKKKSVFTILVQKTNIDHSNHLQLVQSKLYFLHL